MALLIGKKIGLLEKTLKDKIFQKDLFWSLLIFLVLPNILFLITSSFIFNIRLWVNIDYMLLAIMFPWLGIRKTTVIFCIILCIDLLDTYAPTYHFRIDTALAALPNLFHIDPRFTAILFVGFFTLIFIFGFLFYKGAKNLSGKRSGVLPVFILGITMLGLYLTERYVDCPHKFACKLVAHPSFNMLVLGGVHNFMYDADAAEKSYVTSALRENIDPNSAELSPKIVLVMVETLALFTDQKNNDIQFKAFKTEAIKSRYEISYGTVPFQGSTIEGEMRELCNMKINLKFIFPESIDSTGCIPKQLKDKNYKTIAYHSFNSSLFNQSNLYPAIGIEEMYFRPDLEKILPKVQYCGHVTRGLCDYLLIDPVIKRLLRKDEEKQFIYLLTINAHVPSDFPPKEASNFKCELYEITREEEAICKLISYHDGFFEKFTEAMMDERLQDVTFIFVGDHGPTYVNPRKRNLFDYKNVPYVVLKRKTTPSLWANDTHAREDTISTDD